MNSHNSNVAYQDTHEALMAECPFCQKQGSPVRVFENRGTEELKLWRCFQCSCEFLQPQPSDAWLAHEYAGYFSMRQGRAPASKSRLCQLIISKLGELPANPQVLEIGGGEGFFLKELLKARPDARITLVEPQADTTLFPADKVTVHKMLIEEWLATNGQSQYDAIIAMDLIEHLRDPMSVIRRISDSHLKPGGKIVVTTPDAGSTFRGALGRFWPHYKVEHLTYPSTAALQHLARNAKLEVVELKSLAKPLQVGYLIAVLRNFGPNAVRWCGRMAERIIPNFVRTWHVTIPSGELLFVGRKSARRIHEDQ